MNRAWSLNINMDEDLICELRVCRQVDILPLKINKV